LAIGRFGATSNSLAAISIGPPEVVHEIIATRIIAAIRLGEHHPTRLLEAALTTSRGHNEISWLALQLPLLPGPPGCEVAWPIALGNQ
jgi:hypothetical protein